MVEPRSRGKRTGPPEAAEAVKTVPVAQAVAAKVDLMVLLTLAAAEAAKMVEPEVEKVVLVDQAS